MEYVIAGLISLITVGFIAWRVFWNKENAPSYPKSDKDTSGSNVSGNGDINIR
jgi:hypothetical protein